MHQYHGTSFIKKKIVNQYDLNLIWWYGVEWEMWAFPKLFCNFVTKQVSKFCGTNRQLACINDIIKNICPSCGNNDKSRKHITHCTDKGQVAMLADSVGDLLWWMETTPVDAYLIQTVWT